MSAGRATFYMHFDNKEDFLLSGFDALRASLRERQREALVRGRSVDERVFAFTRDMLARRRASTSFPGNGRQAQRYVGPECDP